MFSTETIEIQVENSRYNYVLEILRQLEGVKINVNTAKRKKAQIEFVKETKEALIQIETHQRGEVELKTLEEFLDAI